MRSGVGSLPAELTSFVGRRRELRETKRLLSVARLLTLTGIGGVGKTRLALRVAAGVRRAFADGVWFVGLADLRDPGLLVNTVTTALGLPEMVDPEAGLAEFVEDKNLLLVLDSCEHLVDECAVLTTKLLAAAGELRVLATSRQALRVEGEHILHVEPMSVPHGPGADVHRSDAVTLFVERAVAVVPGFELTADNKAAVSRICARLEGIPLAVELAAVRLRMLSVAQLLHGLDRRFALLTSGPRGALPRQRTLEATIDWSFGLCSPEEQRMWTRMSVFPGGFDLAAARVVYGRDDLDAATVLDIVAGLVDKSVVIRQDGTFGWHGWYRMLDTVREYGAAKLAGTGEEPEVRASQVGHYLDLARRFQAEEFGSRQLEWLDRLRHEHANLRAVLEYCLSTPERAGDAVDIASSLLVFWFHGLLVEGYQYLRRGLEHVHDGTIRRARALYAATVLAILTGAAATARQPLAELAELADDLDDEQLRARHLECLGWAKLYTGDLPGGTELLEQALAGHRATGDTRLEFDTLILLGGAYFFLGDPRGADLAAEALALTDRHGARWSKGYALWTTAIHRWRLGEPRQAGEHLREAIKLEEVDRTLLAFLLEALAWCHSSSDEHERAARLLGCAHTAWRLSGARVGEMTPHRDFDERCASQARTKLGTALFNTAFAEGTAFELDQIIQYALGETPEDTTTRPARTDPPGGLTKREREIAELVARGLTNKAIATHLVIAKRTVETHVENILVKLGFNSRTQVAPWLTEQDHEATEQPGGVSPYPPPGRAR
jgi:predicted ATPase/DNA-binding CsgD family transcriptional regulator